MRQQRGLTLVELILAIGIFALMAAMAYGGLGSVISQQEQISEHQDDLRAIQQTYSWMQRDLTQIVNRPVNDGFGGQLDAVEGGNNKWLAFTRTGHINPAGQLRSNLLRVEYLIDDKQLIRRHWPTLDNGAGIKAIDTVLLQDATDYEVRFIDREGNTNTTWPPLTVAESGPADIPRAIEIRLTDSVMGEIRWLFETGS